MSKKFRIINDTSAPKKPIDLENAVGIFVGIDYVFLGEWLLTSNYIPFYFLIAFIIAEIAIYMHIKKKSKTINAKHTRENPINTYIFVCFACIICIDISFSVAWFSHYFVYPIYIPIIAFAIVLAIGIILIARRLKSDEKRRKDAEFQFMRSYAN